MSVADSRYTFEREQERSKHLSKGLRRIAEIFSGVAELSDKVADLRDEAKHVEEGRFSIVVLGAFNRGKSTLLNALAGDDILPKAGIPSTAIISVLRYHPTERVVVHFVEGHLVDGRPTETLGIKEFKLKYVLPIMEQVESQVASADADGLLDEDELEQVRLKAARDQFSHIDYAEVGFPCDLCRHGVEFVDSPGFEDSDARTKRARDFLDKSDAVIFLLDATQPITENDTQNLNWIMSRGKRAIFFVINKWNFLEMMERTPKGRQQVEQRFRSKLTRYVADKSPEAYDRWVFKVNALGALEGRLARPVDHASLIQSNVPQFEQAFERFLVEERIQAQDDALLTKARNVCDDVGKVFKGMLSLREQSLDELISKKTALAPKLDQLRGVRRHIEEFIEGHMIRTQKMLSESLNAHMRAIDVEAVVKKGVEPDRQPFDLSVLETWFAWEAVWDAGRILSEKAFSWTGWIEKDESKRYAAKVRAALEPQIIQLVTLETKNWESSTASLQMRNEGHELIEYLKREASDYERILAEIGQIFHETDRKHINVEELVKQWLRTGITHRLGASKLTLDATGMAIDLAPLAGSIAIEIAAHIKGLALPIIGTIISVALAFWRQGKTRDKITLGIIEGLKQALANIPNAAQRKQIDETIEPTYMDLKNRVLSNINIHIGSIEVRLNEAIADVERGDVDVQMERDRLNGLQDAARAELATIESVCNR